MRGIDGRITFGKESGQLSLMLILTCIIQLLIIYKSAMIASGFGASTELDAYNFTNNIASFLMTFAAGGVTAVIIPSYINKKRMDSVNTFITIVYGTIILLIVAIYILRKPIIQMLTSRDSAFQQQVCDLLWILFILQWLPSILGVTTAYFQCINKYLIPKITLLISNIIIVTGLVILKNFTIYQYVNYLLLGSCVQFVLECALAVKCGFRYRPSFCLKDGNFKEMMSIFIPTLYSSGVYKIHGLVDSMIASNLGVGQLTILTYSNMVVALVNTMVIDNLTVYAYPKIVKKANLNIWDGQRAMWNYCIAFHSFICIIIAGSLVVGREFLYIFLERGKFGSDAVDSVYICMSIYVIGQQFNIVRDLIYRFFYSQNNTRDTFKNGVLVSVLNIVLSIILSQYIGIYGIVIGTTASGAVSLLMILIRLHKKYKLITGITGVWLELSKNFITCLIAVSLCFFIKSILWIGSVWGRLFVYGFLCVMIYGICMLAFHSKVLKFKL